MIAMVSKDSNDMNVEMREDCSENVNDGGGGEHYVNVIFVLNMIADLPCTLGWVVGYKILWGMVAKHVINIAYCL